MENGSVVCCCWCCDRCSAPAVPFGKLTPLNGDMDGFIMLNLADDQRCLPCWPASAVADGSIGAVAAAQSCKSKYRSSDERARFRRRRPRSPGITGPSIVIDGGSFPPLPPFLLLLNRSCRPAVRCQPAGRIWRPNIIATVCALFYAVCATGRFQMASSIYPAGVCVCGGKNNPSQLARTWAAVAGELRTAQIWPEVHVTFDPVKVFQGK